MMLFLKPDELEKISDNKIVRDYMDELIKINKVFKDFKISEFISPEEDMKKRIATVVNVVKEKGLEKGMQKGIQKGIQRGRKEGMREVSNNLLKMEIPLEQISKATNLSIEELQSLELSRQ